MEVYRHDFLRAECTDAASLQFQKSYRCLLNYHAQSSEIFPKIRSQTVRHSYQKSPWYGLKQTAVRHSYQKRPRYGLKQTAVRHSYQKRPRYGLKQTAVRHSYQKRPRYGLKQTAVRHSYQKRPWYGLKSHELPGARLRIYHFGRG